MPYRYAFLIFLAFLQTGCFEISADAKFTDKGEALVNIELLMAPELVALLASPEFNKKGQSQFDIIKDCGKAMPSEFVKEGVRSIKSTPGNKNGMLSCTLTIDFSDPIAALAQAKLKASKGGGPDLTVLRVSDRQAYRIEGAIAPQGSKEFDAGSAIAAMMFANRFVTIRIAGLHIETANGEVSPDRKSVTWKMPVIAFLGPSSAPAFKFEAVVIYNEGWIEWLKRLVTR